MLVLYINHTHGWDLPVLLGREGHEVLIEEEKEVLEFLRKESPLNSFFALLRYHIIVVEQGPESPNLIRRIRKVSDAPILYIISSDQDDQDEEVLYALLNLGVDRVIAGISSEKVFLAHVSALMRRS